MNKSFQQNRKQLASKRNKFKRNSKSAVYSNKSVVVSVKKKHISEAKTKDAIEKIQRQAKKDRERLVAIYVVVFTIIIATFAWVLF